MIYEGTISYVGIDNRGNDKAIKENYVLQGKETFSDAEECLYKDFEEYHLTDFDVIALKRSSIKEIANERTNDNDLLWIAEMQNTFTDDNGVEKVTKYKVLFYSQTFDSAKTFISNYVKQGYDLDLVSLKLTKFKDIL